MYVDTSCRDTSTAVPDARHQRTRGRTRIVFRRRGHETCLDRLYQEGAAKVRLPRIADDMAEAVLINTAGGMTGGDSFAVDVALLPEARVVLTTQACERIYRSSGGDVEVTAHIEIGPEACLHWLPQETILFDGGRLARRLDVDLADDAEFLAVEAVIFGREAMGETVRQGFFHDRWRIRRGGRLIFADDLRLEAAIAELSSRQAVLQGNRAMATVLLASRDCERLIDQARAALGPFGGASAWGGKLLVRVLAPDGFSLRRVLLPLLSVVTRERPLPKVWQL